MIPNNWRILRFSPKTLASPFLRGAAFLRKTETPFLLLQSDIHRGLKLWFTTQFFLLCPIDHLFSRLSFSVLVASLFSPLRKRIFRPGLLTVKDNFRFVFFFPCVSLFFFSSLANGCLLTSIRRFRARPMGQNFPPIVVRVRWR